MAEPDLMEILGGFLEGALGGGSQSPIAGGMFQHPLMGQGLSQAGLEDPFATPDIAFAEIIALMDLMGGLGEGAADREAALQRALIGAGGGGGGAAGAEASKYSADLQHKLGQAQLAETLRANKAAELETTRGRALDAASSAVNAFLQSQSLADARRLAGIQETRALLPSLVDPNRKFFESAGAAHAARRSGLPFASTAIQHQQIVNPSLQLGMGAAAGNTQIQDAIASLQRTGNA